MGQSWGEAGARKKNGGRWENVGAVTSGVTGNKRDREDSGVNLESHRVREGEGGCEASRVAKPPREGVMEWAGESSQIRAPTPPEWLRGPGETKP